MNNKRLHIIFILLAVFIYPLVFQTFHSFSHHSHEIFEAIQHSKKLDGFNSEKVQKDSHCLVLELNFLPVDLPTKTSIDFVIYEFLLSISQKISSLNPVLNTTSFLGRAPPILSSAEPILTFF